MGSFYVATSAQSVVFLPAARTPACFQAAALPQPPLNINWWGNEKHITGNGHGAQRERAYLRDKRFPWAFNFHAKAHSGKQGKLFFSVKNNTDLYLIFEKWFIFRQQGKHLQ